MLPLSFSEYLELVQKDKDSAFAEYMRYGSLPFVAAMDKIDEKVDTYLEGIYNTVIVIAGKQLLKANKKYYIADLGIRNHILPKRSYDLGFSIENIVFFELLRRGFKVVYLMDWLTGSN